MPQLILVAEPSSAAKLSGLSLAYLVFTRVRNNKSSPALDSALSEAMTEVRSGFKTTADISENGVVKGIRSIFHAVGTDPTKERPSGEALMRRVVDGKGVYRINAVVDVNNIVSLRSGCPCGVYDMDRISGEKITLLAGRPGDGYEGISGKQVNGEGRLLSRDSVSVFGGPVADSKRTSITLEAKNVLMLIYFPSSAPRENMGDAMRVATELMKSCCGAAMVASGVSSF